MHFALNSLLGWVDKDFENWRAMGPDSRGIEERRLRRRVRRVEMEVSGLRLVEELLREWFVRARSAGSCV